MTMKSPFDESRAPLPGGWPSIAQQRQYWEEREKTEYQLIQMLDTKLKELDATVLKMVADLQELKKLLEKCDLDCNEIHKQIQSP